MKTKKTLVVGASLKPERYSNKAIRLLEEYDHEVVALGLREGEVGRTTIITDRSQIKDIDTVTLYIGPDIQPAYYDFMLELQPRRVIFNPGTENSEFVALLQDRGIEAEVGCTLVMLRARMY